MESIKNIFSNSNEKHILNHVSLYMFPTCPFCIKVFKFIKAKNIEIKQLNIRASETAYNELLDGGGKKQVPCLKIQEKSKDTEWLYESDDIIDYLAQEIKN